MAFVVDRTMGIYDRDYYKSEPPGYGVPMRAPQTMIVTLVIINAGIWLLDYLTTPRPAGTTLTGLMALHGDTLLHPWMWWKFVTYGFAHARAPVHVLGNMLGLWFLGRDVEALYGRWEFLRLYLGMVVFGGLVWAALMLLQGAPADYSVIGASGAVVGVVVLFALHFPRRTILLFFVLPMPAWMLGVMIVLFDLFGAAGAGERNVAYPVHLAGAALAFAYSRLDWNFGRAWHRVSAGWRRARGPRLAVRRPEDDRDAPGTNDGEVDRILEKISRQGEASLSRRERKTLQEASHRYQQRRE